MWVLKNIHLNTKIVSTGNLKEDSSMIDFATAVMFKYFDMFSMAYRVSLKLNGHCSTIQLASTA